MKKLNKDWVTEGLLDFEYKKYVLLAYLRHIEEHFGDVKLYPFLTDLIERYNDLHTLQKEKKTLSEDFPKRISRIDLNKIELVYKKLYESDQLPEEVEEIISYAIPTMEKTLGIGREIHEEVSSDLVIDTVGIVPLYKDEGYLFMENGNNKLTEVYQFSMKKFIMHNEQYRGLHLQWIDRISRGIGETLEQIKLKLIETYRVLPNPATYLVHSRRPFPLNETMLPMTKRLLLQTISGHQ